VQRNRFRIFILVLTLGLAAGPAPLRAQPGQSQNAQAQTGQAQPNPSAQAIAAALEKSGVPYTKVSDGVWEVPARGKNAGEFPIRIASAGDTLLLLVKMVDRKSITLKDAMLVKMLELNDYFDTAKIALDENMLYARIDLHARLVDGPEMKYLIEQIINVVDETYPHIKPFMTGAK
jgi:hypothetical protein